MKRLFALLMALSIVFAGTAVPARAAGEETNYMAIMMEAAMTGDTARGEEAQQLRDEKIAVQGLAYVSVDFGDMYLLSKIIHAEAGSSWLSDEWKMSVGEVVLNRVASPEFPDTIQEVLEQKGQYYGKNSRYFNSLLPSERCVSAAVRLLEGERVLNEPAVVFQSNYVLGSGVFQELRDDYLGSTYLCYSSHRELYES